ncbi:MAG: VOC family protein [Nevskiales bacterium]
MQVQPYLFFDGNCAEAMRFYEHTLGAKLEMMMTHGESPMAAQSPPGNADRIMHACLVKGDFMLMASDAMGGEPYGGMKGFSLSLACATADEAQQRYDALARGGKVTLPLQKTFWSESFGMLVDRFGTPWMVTVAA